MLLRRLALAALLALTAPLAHAQGPDDQLLTLVSAELPGYVPGVDTSTLSRTQLATIYSILHSDNSGGDKQLMIQSVLGGRYALRSLFLN